MSSKEEEFVQAVPSAQRLAAVRVLVVDDDGAIREDISELFAREGAAVSTGASVEAGLAAVETFHPDAIVCDIAMPGEDGYAFVRRLRALDHARGGHIPAVAFTALAGERERERCLAAGFQAPSRNRPRQTPSSPPCSRFSIRPPHTAGPCKLPPLGFPWAGRPRAAQFCGR